MNGFGCMSLLLTQATTCRVAYQPSFAWWFPAAGVGVLLIAVILTIALKGWKRAFTGVIAGFALLWVFGAGARVFGDYSAARSAAASSTTPVVEGLVENFHPAPPGGH